MNELINSIRYDKMHSPTIPDMGPQKFQLKKGLTHVVSKLNTRRFLILLFACTYLPFLGQAFHIDDTIYLETAENILKKPLYPYDYPAAFEGFLAPDAASHSHLPLTSYYLALIRTAADAEKEWMYHVAFMVFPLLAIFGFYELAQRYSRFPLAAASLLLVAPAFLVLSHTLMPDVALLAFWILALSRFLRIVDAQGKPSDWVVCVLSLLAAAFISLLSFGLVLLMAAHLMVKTISTQNSHVAKTPTAKILILLALPLLLWLLWYLRAYFHYDRFVLANTLLHMNQRTAFSGQLIAAKALSFILNIGGTLLFPPVLWYGIARPDNARAFLLIFLFSFVPFYIWLGGWSWTQILLFAVFFSSGLLVLWKCFSWFGAVCILYFRRSSEGHFSMPLPSRSISVDFAQRDNTDRIVLLVWFFGVLASYILVFYAGSVRYSLLALPPMILLWMAALEHRVRDSYFLRNLIWLGVVLTALYSLAISYGDYQFANVYRQTAQEINRDYQQPGRTVWFAGDWGFRYYMKQRGAQILLKTATRPKLGDIIVKPYVAMPWVTLYDGDEYTDLLEQRFVRMEYPIRILDFSSHAGFYSTGWGILPFSINKGDRWEWFNIFRIKKEYKGLIPEQERPW